MGKTKRKPREFRVTVERSDVPMPAFAHDELIVLLRTLLRRVAEQRRTPNTIARPSK